MKNVKFNVIGTIAFIIFSLLDFIIDIVKGGGGSSETFSLLFIVGLIVSGALFLKGTYKVLLHINPYFHKIPLFVLTLILTVVQLIISYIFAIIIGLGVVAPIMIKYGYYVTMP